MSEQILVGLDCGTTSIKALAVSLTGEVLASAARPTPWRHHGPHSDIDPRVLADTAIGVCADAASAVPGSVEVLGIGTTGIAEAGILLDSAGEPCAPTLAWFDPRGEVGPISEVVSRRDFQRATGRRLNSKPSIAKIVWLQNNIPTASHAVRHLCVAEWIVRALGGEEVSEASLTSRTGLMELGTRRPWAIANEIVGDFLPGRRVWAGESAGLATGDIPPVLRGAVLSVAGLDHQAAMLVSGGAREGALFDSLGTAEALMRTVRPLSTDAVEQMTDLDIDVDWSVVPDRQILLAGRVTGLTLERVSAMLGATDRESRRVLGEAALAAVRDDDAPRLVDISNDAVSLVGITDGISPGLVWRCAVEDLVAYAGAPLDLMAQIAGPATSAVLVGGWSRNPMVAAEKQRQLGEYRTSDVQEPGALGAAFLAGVAGAVFDRPAQDGLPVWH
jgi:sugar (pentulose or hexulose) kinase